MNEAPDYLSKYGYLEEDVESEASYGAMATLSVMRGVADLSELEEPVFKGQAKKLQRSIDVMTKAGQSWIQDRKLDAVFIYNGRLDLTNAILLAAQSLNVPVFSVERSWSGNGMQIVADGTPLQLHRHHEMVEHWSRYPLTTAQIERACSFVSGRLAQTSIGEFKQWNAGQTTGLAAMYTGFWAYLPSSIFERIGHPDWSSGWESDLRALELLLSERTITRDRLVVRGHPQWKQLTPVTQEKYRNWCKQHEVVYLESDSQVSTQELISVSDGVIVNGSSTALEAGMLGKRILNLSPTFYEKGGFCINLKEPSDVIKFARSPAWIDSSDVVIRCLRAIYTINYRYMQLTNSVTALNSYDYSFNSIDNKEYFEELVLGRRIPPDDNTFANSDSAEKQFIESARGDFYSYLNARHTKTDIANKVKGSVEVLRSNKYALLDILDKLVR
ncbi:hypothetical protein OAT10_01855 [Luminiphilus sp.]|nr:hypothetical protein [Luminiphilus sp.]